MYQNMGRISRSDILKALHAGESSEKYLDIANFIAKNMGLSLNETLGSNNSSKEDSNNKDGTNFPTPIEPSPIEPSPINPNNFFLKNRKKLQSLSSTKLSNIKVEKVKWEGRPKKSPNLKLFSSLFQLLAYLQPYINQQNRNTHKVDIDKVVEILSYARCLEYLPRKVRKITAHIHIIDDRHIHLTPYWLNHSWFARFIKRYYNNCEISRSVLLEGDQIPRQISPDGFQEWQVPIGSLVVILSDLGVVNQSNYFQPNLWLNIEKKLRNKLCNILVFSPRTTALYEYKYRKLFTIKSWSNGEQDYKNFNNTEQQVEDLLIILSPAIRIEPGLIKNMRLTMMEEYGNKWRIPTEVESLVWQHPDIEHQHAVAATWSSDARKKNLRMFTDSNFLSLKEKITSLKVIRSWRGRALSPQIWFEELMSIKVCGIFNDKILKEDKKEATLYFEKLAQSVNLSDLDRLWLKRVERRIPYDDNNINRQVFNRLFPEKKHTKTTSKFIIFFQGEKLLLCSYDINFTLTENYNYYLSLIETESKECLDAHFFDRNGKELENYSFGLKTSIEKIPPATHTFTIQSNVEKLFFSQISSQNNREFGRDKYGLYVDVLISTIQQRFRYIEPGSFQTGLPEEDSNTKVLMPGFWLADTPVTENMFQAVMGERYPIRSEEPATEIGWKGIKELIEVINKSNIKVMLPTKEQWEYACRAGTTTAFYFGDEISKEKVNYQKKNSSIALVKNYLPNIWGLYQMHGNVWECCFDSDTKLKTKHGGTCFLTDEFARSSFNQEVLGNYTGEHRGVRLVLVI